MAAASSMAGHASHDHRALDHRPVTKFTTYPQVIRSGLQGNGRMLPRMTLTFHRNHRGLAPDVDLPATLRVAVDPELWSIAPALAFTSDGRNEAVPVGDPTATLRVVPLRPTDELRSVVETSAVPVVVFARRGPAEGGAVVSALRAGV